MITRLVKMTFRPESVSEFQSIFEEINTKITSFSGCHEVTLLQDNKQPNVFFTYSIWDSEEDLDAYRNSEFFADTWRRTKALFADKAEAWTTEVIDGKS